MTVESFDPNAELVSVQAAAIEHFRKQLQQHPEANAVRLSIKPSGCSGFMYVLDFVASAEADDLRQTLADDVLLLIAADSVQVVRGTEIDYVREGINRSIRFNNPNATSECGCGESFNVS